MDETMFWIIFFLISIASAGWLIGLWGLADILKFALYIVIELPIRIIFLTIDWVKTIRHNWRKTKREIEIEEAFNKLLEEKLWHEFARNSECVKRLALTGEVIRPPSVTFTADDIHKIMTENEIAQLMKKAEKVGIKINDLETNNG